MPVVLQHHLKENELHFITKQEVKAAAQALAINDVAIFRHGDFYYVASGVCLNQLTDE